jgi:hypothetical protein
VPRSLAVALIVLTAGLFGCGIGPVGVGPGATSALCPPKGCPSVIGTVRVCDGHSRLTCAPAESVKISVLQTPRDNVLIGPARVRDRYCLALETPGRYVVEAQVGNRVVKRTFDAVGNRTAIVNSPTPCGAPTGGVVEVPSAGLVCIECSIIDVMSTDNSPGARSGLARPCATTALKERLGDLSGYTIVEADDLGQRRSSPLASRSWPTMTGSAQWRSSSCYRCSRPRSARRPFPHDSQDYVHRTLTSPDCGDRWWPQLRWARTVSSALWPTISRRAATCPSNAAWPSGVSRARTLRRPPLTGRSIPT